MGKFTGKQKGVIGFVAAVLAAAAYFFSMTMGWVPNWLADEPEAKPAAEQVATAADAAKDAKPAVETKAKEVKPAVEVKAQEVKPAVEAKAKDVKAAVDAKAADVKPAAEKAAKKTAKKAKAVKAEEKK